jgi:chemotaxis methyl-accepting protein methylase
MMGKYRENGVAEMSPNCMYQQWMRRRRKSSMRKKNRIRISVLFNRSANW